MSTRCQILVEGQHGTPVYIYRHSDGYPDTENGVIAAIKPICEEFLRGRGWDPEYMVAHIVSGMIRQHVESTEQYYRSGDSLFTTEEEQEAAILRSKFLGYGVDAVIHTDIEYLYVVTREGIEIRQPSRQDHSKYVRNGFVAFDLKKGDR